MRFFRADAAYAMPDLYKRLEEASYFLARRARVEMSIDALPVWS